MRFKWVLVESFLVFIEWSQNFSLFFVYQTFVLLKHLLGLAVHVLPLLRVIYH